MESKINKALVAYKMNRDLDAAPFWIDNHTLSLEKACKAYSRELQKENEENKNRIQELEFYRDNYYEKLGDEAFEALESDLKNEMEWRKNKEALVHSLELKLLAKEKENEELRELVVDALGANPNYTDQIADIMDRFNILKEGGE